MSFISIFLLDNQILFSKKFGPFCKNIWNFHGYVLVALYSAVDIMRSYFLPAFPVPGLNGSLLNVMEYRDSQKYSPCTLISTVHILTIDVASTRLL